MKKLSKVILVLMCAYFLAVFAGNMSYSMLPAYAANSMASANAATLTVNPQAAVSLPFTGKMLSANEAPTISVADLNNVPAGSRIEVPISLVDNPGIISMMFDVSFDDTVMRFVRSTDTRLLNGHTSPLYNGAGSSPVRLAWNDMYTDVNNTSNGVIVNLEFDVLASAPSGT